MKITMKWPGHYEAGPWTVVRVARGRWEVWFDEKQAIRSAIHIDTVPTLKEAKALVSAEAN